MKARILIIATLATTFAGILPAIDQHLLGLVMPDAKVLAGINMVSAKNSPFGQYVMAQMAPHQDELQKFAVLTGFDPSNDLIEVLAASNASGSKTGLALATGTFNTSAITAAATTHGATTEQYNGATLVTDPKDKTGAIAFLGSTIALAGDIASVKAAVDRQSAPSKIDSNLLSQATTLSANQDAWVVSIAPLPAPPKNATSNPQQSAIPGMPVPAGALQQIVGGSAGVKFGTNIVVTALAVADNAQDATNLAGMLQLLANMAKMQADKNPDVAALANGLVVSSSGTNVNITFTLPQDQLQKLIAQQQQPKPATRTPHKKQ